MFLGLLAILLLILMTGRLALLMPNKSKPTMAPVALQPRTSLKTGSTTRIREFDSAEEQRRYWDDWMRQCGQHAADCWLPEVPIPWANWTKTVEWASAPMATPQPCELEFGFLRRNLWKEQNNFLSA